MSTDSPDNLRALSSEDGNKWQQSGPVREARWSAEPGDTSVGKLVLGRLGGAKEGDDWSAVLFILESDSGLKDHFPNLTHLHLWGLPIEKLGPLPEGLKVLDVRKCGQLAHLPTLPDKLETLDLAGCVALNDLPKQGIARLRWFHVDECPGIPANRISSFLEDCLDLEEFTAKGCTQIVDLTLPRQERTPPEGDWHPQFPPYRLKKLVLEGCSSLTKLPDLSAYPWLHHLNLNWCGGLEVLPSLPIGFTTKGEMEIGIRYLLAHGCFKLREFVGMDVRNVHLSKTETENVAAGFRTMQRLRQSPGSLVRAKLLLLGSGRCGKTTVAKALQWYEMEELERSQRPDLSPSVNQVSTHGIQFWPWETTFKTKSPDLKAGHAHLWDFAGQEIYHNTHRLFASEGSVFLIVTTSEKEHQNRVEREASKLRPEEVEAFRRENEYREIKYWLDYLRTTLGLATIAELGSRAGKVEVRVICTGGRDDKSAREELRKQAGDYATLLDTGEIPLSAIDFHGQEWETDFKEISNWTALAIGTASDGFGHRVPGIYSSAADFCERELARTGGREIIAFEDWEKEIANVAPVPNGPGRRRLITEQARATARFLHQCGVLFWMQNGKKDGDLLIDQRWGVDLIYGLLNWREAERFRTESFTLIGPDRFEELLLANRCYARLPEQQQRTFVDFLDACDVCVRVGDRWMAAQRELLPVETQEVQSQLEILWSGARVPGEEMVNHCFAIHGADTSLLGNSDYRETLAFFVRGMQSGMEEKLFPIRAGDGIHKGLDRGEWNHATTYHTEWRFWSDGFLMKVEESLKSASEAADLQPARTRKSIVLQVEWRPVLLPETGRKGFAGGLFIQFLAPDGQGYEDRLRDILFGVAGPLAIFAGDKHVESDHRSDDLSKEAFGSRRGYGMEDWSHADGPDRPGFRYDVAISYRSAQREAVAALVHALREAKITHCYEYSGDDLNALQIRPGGSHIIDIYDYLKFAKILIVVASEEYFEQADLEWRKNLYCPVELAEAVQAHRGYSREEKEKFRMTEGARRPSRFFWLADGLSANDIVDRTKSTLDTYFSQVSKRRAPDGLRSSGLLEIDEREYLSMEKCTEGTVISFLNDVGRNQKQIIRKGRDEAWIQEIVSRIKEEL